MSTRLIQDLHAGISRRDWSAVETAANAIRDESEKVRRSLAATDFGSLPADYSTLRMAEDRMEQLSRFYTAPQTNLVGVDLSTREDVTVWTAYPPPGDHHELLMRLQAVQHATDRPYAASVAKDAGDAIKALLAIRPPQDHLRGDDE
jgi:hypothetical protein